MCAALTLCDQLHLKGKLSKYHLPENHPRRASVRTTQSYAIAYFLPTNFTAPIFSSPSLSSSIISSPQESRDVQLSRYSLLNAPQSHAHHIFPAGSFKMMRCNNCTAFSNPSLTLKRESSCSMEMIPSYRASRKLLTNPRQNCSS